MAAMTEPPSRPEPANRYSWVTFVLPAVCLACTALAEYINGRILICKCGYVKLWEGVVNGPENSQHIADWYSLSHIVHGFLFFGATYLMRSNWSLQSRLALATVVECAWEILENSSFIINRYRQGTVSLDYFGDSIVNSMSDVCFMILGFIVASRIPYKWTIAAGLSMEFVALAVIRDNLTLNVIMLIHPIEAIRNWQAAL